jgi:hypothetical protein
VVKQKKPRKGDLKKQEQQLKKELKEKQKKHPKTVVDIKNIVPVGATQVERAKYLYTHIKTNKESPLSQLVINELEKRESEIFQVYTDKGRDKAVDKDRPISM